MADDDTDFCDRLCDDYCCDEDSDDCCACCNCCCRRIPGCGPKDTPECGAKYPAGGWCVRRDCCGLWCCGIVRPLPPPAAHLPLCARVLG